MARRNFYEWYADHIDSGFRRVGLHPAEKPTAGEVKALLLVGIAVLVNHYDQGIYGLALPRIQEGLGIAEANVGRLSAILAVAIFPAFFVAFLADSVGRRQLLMITLALTALFTGLSAFAENATSFYAFQFTARIFANAEDMLAAVMVVEAMRPQLRGWAIGALAAMGAAGNGLAAGVYAIVDVLPLDWRALYIIGAIPMLMAVWLRRGLEESEIFEAARAERVAAKRSLGDQMRDGLRPLGLLFTAYPRRLAALSASLLPFTIGVVPSLAFMPKLLQDVHHYTPFQVSMLFLAGGTFAICGNLLAGRIADKVGRKSVLVVAGSIAALGGVYGYLWAAGPNLVVCWMITLFAFFAASTSVAALTGEIFPTSYRATASAMRGLIGATGAGIGLLLQSELYEMTGSHSEAIVWLLCLVPVGLTATLLFMPETAGRNLEDIAPEVA